MLKSYLKRIFEVSKRGDAREESFYSCLEELLKNYAISTNKKEIQVTTLPKKTEAGNPDFRVWDGKQHITGYIEAKDPGTENLDRIETEPQLQRYLSIFPNMILTNFFEFRLYRDSRLIDNVQIARPYAMKKLGTIPPLEKEKEFLSLLEKFFSFSLPRTYTAKSLAVELAKRTRFLKEQVIIEELKEDEKNGSGYILGFYEAFQKYLIYGLSKEDFADLYSQTITYGLFAARTRAISSVSPLEKGGEGGFNRKLAYDYIPQTIGILREVFEFVSRGKLPVEMEWIIDDISNVLAVTNVFKILDEYFREHKGKDPVVHFYETFLAEYDPKTREKRGVYYTPEPVVSYIVRSLHCILQEHFEKHDGFASSGVTVLDPAAGTLTFLAEASKIAVDGASQYGEPAAIAFIKECILPNYYGFELMMAPYAIGHLKMSFLLEELGYKLEGDDRFKLYLTNTLEMEELAVTNLPGMASLSEESHLAGKVKKEHPILVILGNPPYSGNSANASEKYITIKGKDEKEKKKKVKTWIGNLIEDYKYVDGKPLGEKNPKWLQDDYVKFIRFAQWKIDTAGEGVLGFITNHSYLDNPTFRGMRQSLMNSFDEIYFLDLHGNSLKKEKCPDGSKDENVFDIQQGVAIAIFVKKREKKDEPIHPMFEPSPQLKLFVKKEPEEKPKKHKCNIYHSEIWGLRENKYDYLFKNDIKKTKWQRLKPKSEFYLFIPRDEGLLKQYETYHKITDIFPVNSVGIVTSRDKFVIDFDKDTLQRRILQFRDKKMPDEIIRQAYDLKDKTNWKLENARGAVRKDDKWEEAIKKILYRPFDEQWIFYHDAVIERSRKEVMRHMMKENLGLITVRQVAEGIFNHALVSDTLVESRITLSNKGIAFLFPLYLYKEKNNPSSSSKGGKTGFAGSPMMIFEDRTEYGVREPNISPLLIEQLTKYYKKPFASDSSFLRKQESRDEEIDSRLHGNDSQNITPEQIFYYIYAVLYSNIYRTKYAEFLKIDFPRIPWTKNYKLFLNMAEYGKNLVDLHLLKTDKIDSLKAQLKGKGDNKVEKVWYDNSPSSPFTKGGKEGDFTKVGMGGFGCVYINKTQYFEKIPPVVWTYQIGGYQVLDKWLKDRKGRTLSFADIQTYCKIATAIQKTIDIQQAIDYIYVKIEKDDDCV